MPPSGPITAPDRSDTIGIRVAIGSRRQSIFETSPVRLSTIDSSRLVGAFRYFTRRPTTSENGRQIAGKSHGFATMTAFSQMTRFSTSKTTSHASTTTAPITATTTTWTYGWTRGAAVGALAGAVCSVPGPLAVSVNLAPRPSGPRRPVHDGLPGDDRGSGTRKAGARCAPAVAIVVGSDVGAAGVLLLAGLLAALRA